MQNNKGNASKALATAETLSTLADSLDAAVKAHDLERVAVISGQLLVPIQKFLKEQREEENAQALLVAAHVHARLEKNTDLLTGEMEGISMRLKKLRRKRLQVFKTDEITLRNSVARRINRAF